MSLRKVAMLFLACRLALLTSEQTMRKLPRFDINNRLNSKTIIDEILVI